MYSSLQAALLFVPLLALVGSSLAGPVQEREVDGRSASTDHPTAPVPALSGRSMEQGAAPNLVAVPMTPATSGDAASAPSTSALAAEIINEAEAGAQTTSEQTRYGKAPALGLAIAPGPKGSGATRPSDDEWGLREMGKAAVSWIKEIAPWLRSDADQDSTGHSVTPDRADWSTSSLNGDALGRNARGNATQLPDALPDVSLASTATVGTGKSLASTGLEPQQNIVSTVYSFVGEVLAHPLTWLVVCLFVIGGAVVKRIDRRPTK